VTFGPSDTLTSTTLTIANAVVACSPISVSWEATDTVILELLGSITTSNSASPTTGTGSTTKPSTSSPTSSGTQTHTSTPSSLSSGAKAGIAITVVIVTIAAFIGVFFFFRRRGKRQAALREGERPLPPNTHELLTKDNAHELLTKHNVPLLDSKKVPRGSPNELPNESALQTAELYGSLGNSDGAFSSSTGVSSIGASHDDIPNKRRVTRPAISEEEEERVGLLKDRIEKIREEKERLKRIQELEDMEEMTTRQIAESAQASGGGRIQELEDMEETMKREILDTELRRAADG